MDKGFLLVAGGAKKYFYQACNLAASIKVNNIEAPIALYYDDRNTSIRKELKKFNTNVLFDFVRPLSKKHYYLDGKKNFGYMKLKTFDITPFEKTIFVDADSLFFNSKNVAKLFNFFEDKNFWFNHEGKPKLNENKLKWFELKEIERYLKSSGLNLQQRFPDIRSYIFGFDKTETSKKFFDKSLDVYETIKGGNINLRNEWHCDFVPDEPCFQLSLFLGNKDYYKTNIVEKNFFLNTKWGTMEEIMKKCEALNYHGVTFSGDDLIADWVYLYEKKNLRNFEKLSCDYTSKLTYSVN